MAKRSKKMQKPQKKHLSDKASSWIAVGVVFGTVALVILGILAYNLISVWIQRPAPADRGDSPAIDGEYEALDGSLAFDNALYKIDAQDGAVDKAGLMTELKNRDEQTRSYQLLIQDKDTGKTFEMNYWVESSNGVGVYEYIFKGYDVGVDLEGIYYRTVIDGKPTIIDYQTGQYHTSGDFFVKYLPKFSELTHDNLLSGIYKDGASMQVGTNNATGASVLLGDGVSISAIHTGLKDVRILDTRGESDVGYSILYGKAYSMPNI